MLTALFTSALAVLVALAWVGVCLLPLALAWGLWLWFKSPSDQQLEQQQTEFDAFMSDNDAFIARFKAEQAARNRRLRHQ
jgi:hypothetical protein